MIRDYIRNQGKEDERLEQLNMGKRSATEQVAQPNRGRVSVPAQAALSGSPNQGPGFAGDTDFPAVEPLYVFYFLLLVPK